MKENMSGDLLIYGSYGYMGALIARRAVGRGIDPILAGRKRGELEAQADDLGLDYRVFDLDDERVVAGQLDGVETVLHCAGPFVHTYKPMVDACLGTGTTYLDITGEIDVFEAISKYDDRATEAGVMLMPGVGFDVVAIDCLAARLHERLPSAIELTLAFDGLESLSPGTAKTIVEGMSDDPVVRRDGRIVTADSDLSREVDVGNGPEFAMLISWGDVSTAYHTTGIRNVEVYVVTGRIQFQVMRAMSRLDWLVDAAPVQSVLKRFVEVAASGPSRQRRETATVNVWGRVTDGEESASARLCTSEGYEFTVRSALEIATRTLDGDAPAGYQTPAEAFGPDLVLECDEDAEYGSATET